MTLLRWRFNWGGGGFAMLDYVMCHMKGMRFLLDFRLFSNGDSSLIKVAIRNKVLVTYMDPQHNVFYQTLFELKTEAVAIEIFWGIYMCLKGVFSDIFKRSGNDNYKLIYLKITKANRENCSVCRLILFPKHF